MDEIKNNILLAIVQELAETIDVALLPQTSISSLGLKLALRLRPSFTTLQSQHDETTRQTVFADELKRTLAEELSQNLSITPLQDSCLRLEIARCPFFAINSPTLCTIVHSIIAGFGFMSFGYCKITLVNGPGKLRKPCCIDLYATPTESTNEMCGMECTKDSIILLKEVDQESIESQRRERRKAFLGIFNNLAYGLNRQFSNVELAKSFVESLSSIQDISVATIYLKDRAANRFTLAAQYGLRENVIPLVREIANEVDSITASDDDIVKHVDDTNWYEFGVCRRSTRSFTTIKLKFEGRLVGILNIGLKSAISLGPDFSETINTACTLLAAGIDGSRLYFELDKIYMDSISLLNNLTRVTDRFTQDHSKHVAEIAELIAMQMDLSQEDITLIYEAGYLHDIGKITIPPEILNKAGELSNEEFELIKEHPVAGEKLLAPVSAYRAILPAIKHHHERLDGSGYPDGLRDKDIPLHARIIAVADVYDAMLAPRAYRKPLTEQDVLKELQTGRGVKYDAAAVDALITLSRSGKLASSKQQAS